MFQLKLGPAPSPALGCALARASPGQTGQVGEFSFVYMTARVHFCVFLMAKHCAQ
jgi:hypothetical protein